MLKQLFTVPTTKLDINRSANTSSDHLLINKYGIHENRLDEMIDTGMGYAYRSMTNKTHSFQEYENNNKSDKEYYEVIKYIKDNSVPYDESKKAKLNIKIFNHAHPLIELAPNSVIYQDNNIIFKNKDIIWKHTIGDHSKVNYYKQFQLYEHIFDKKPTQTQISECTVELIANQWSMLYWNSFFNGTFMCFCSQDELTKSYYTDDKKKFELLPYAPGGKTNLGTYEDGKKNEYFIEEGQLYELQFVVSPAIKVKTKSYYQNQSRYPFSIYPFIEGKNTYDLNDERYRTNISCDLHASIVEGETGDVVDNNKLGLEHNFGIDVTFKKI